MKKFSLSLAAILVSAGILSSCFASPPTGEETTAPIETTTIPAAIDPETGEPIRILPAETKVISLEPESLNGDLVRTDSTFRVKTREDLAESELSALLTVRPEREVHITKNGACDYTLSLGTLPKGEVVKVMLGDGNGNTVDSWGFETEDEFRVRSTLPMNLSNYASVRSGIELSLSAQADLTRVSDYIEISPSVSGSFTNYSKTLVFAPSEPLKADTVYTVRVKAGLPSADGAALSEDTVFSFRTMKGGEDDFCYSINGISESYLPDDPVAIDVYASESFFEQEFDLKLYRYPDASAYRGAIEEYNAATDWDGEYILPTEGLELVSDEKAPLYTPEKIEGSFNERKKFFVLPNHLEEGCYLADLVTELDGREYRIQRLIQISPISVYSAVLSGQACFFLNDASTGRAAENAGITLSVGGGDFGGETDAEGICVFDYSVSSEVVRTEETENGRKESRYGILEIRYGDRVYCDRMLCVPDRELTPAEKYYMYLFTDREAYLTTDTVRFWGMILPREESFGAPTDLTIRLGWSGNDGISTSVKVSAGGTFTGELAIENYADRWYEPLTMLDGETELYSKSVMVQDYEKPIYVMTPDLPEVVWMPQENGIEAGVYLTYYDGTPAAGKKIEIDGIKTSPTDENGYAKRTIKSGEGGRLDIIGSPSRPWADYWFGYSLTGNEDRFVYATGHVLAFARDVELDIKDTRAEDGTTTLELSGYAVKFDENMELDQYGEPKSEEYRDGPVDFTVNARLKRSWTEKQDAGSYYDFIQKKQIQKYRYVSRKEYLGNYSVELKNGIGRLENLPTTDSDSEYYIELSWEDRGGRSMSNNFVVAGNDSRHGWWTDFVTYSLFVATDAEHPYSAKLGEKRAFVLCKDYCRVADGDFTGRLFYRVNMDRFLSLNTTDRNTFEIEMEEAYLPNYTVSAAYFDGRHVFPVRGVEIDFNSEDRRIGLTIETDRDSYAPADTAEVTLTAKTANGKPVPNARILLSVVDEAAFAIEPQTVYPLDIYRAVSYPAALTYTSYIQHSLYDEVNGEGGAGGGYDSVRKEFVDTAYFTEGVSDANGRLTLSVGLPDNVTSWRFTAVAVATLDGGRIYAGSEKRNISATLPLFITPTMVSEYVGGDEIVFAVQCGGDPNAAVTAEVNGAGFTKTLDADTDGEFNFGKLPVGDYTVLFRAEGERGSDAAEYPFRVVGARLTSRIEREFLLDGTTELSPAAWPITLNFYNRDASLYAEILNDLLCLNGSNLDYRLARGYASVERGWEDGSDLSRTVHAETYDLASLYPYAGSDVELTALICTAFPKDVDRTAIEYLLRQEIEKNYCETEDEMASCYLGLAALERPVLNEIRRLLAEKTNLGAGEKLKLCAAVALLGDRDTALKYYLEITEPLVLYEKDGEILAYFTADGSEDSDKIQGDTRLALLAASVLNLPEAESMARWLNRERHREYGCALERVVFLKYYKPALNLSAKLGYTVGGEEKTEEIENFCGISLTFGEEQFKNAEFKALDGNIGCTAIYEGKTDELAGTPELTLSRTLTLIEGEAGKPGAVYRVDLTVEGEGTYYTIEDIVPSNARFLSAKDQYANGKFVIFENKNGRQDVTISLGGIKKANYTIRQITKGEALFESAVVRNSEGDFGIAAEEVLK